MRDYDANNAHPADRVVSASEKVEIRDAGVITSVEIRLNVGSGKTRPEVVGWGEMEGIRWVECKAAAGVGGGHMLWTCLWFVAF